MASARTVIIYTLALFAANDAAGNNKQSPDDQDVECWSGGCIDGNELPPQRAICKLRELCSTRTVPGSGISFGCSDNNADFGCHGYGDNGKGTECNCGYAIDYCNDLHGATKFCDKSNGGGPVSSSRYLLLLAGLLAYWLCSTLLSSIEC